MIQQFSSIQPDLKQLEKDLRFSFKNKSLLLTALTHRSYLNEAKKTTGLMSNERMEFLGDSVLAFWASLQAYLKFLDFPEGKLTFIRTSLVRTETLSNLAEKLDLGKYLQMSKGEELGGGRKNPLLLANCFEAVVGAIYLDQGITAVTKFLQNQFKEALNQIKDPEALKDSKSLLQEKIQAKRKSSPVYKQLSATGPDHAKTFIMGVYVEDKLLAEGSSNSKQAAEEEAAKKALESLK